MTFPVMSDTEFFRPELSSHRVPHQTTLKNPVGIQTALSQT